MRHVRKPDSGEREHAEQQCRREAVPYAQRDINRHADDRGRRTRKRSVQEPRGDTDRQAASREDERREPQRPRGVVQIFHRRRTSEKWQHAREQSRQSEEDTCEHDQSQQPREPVARMKQRVVGRVLADESECQRHPGHRERGGAAGKRGHRHRSAQARERRNIARARFVVDHAGDQEQRALVAGVRDQIDKRRDDGLARAHPEQHRQDAEGTQRRVGEDALQVGLLHGAVGADDHGRRPGHRDRHRPQRASIRRSGSSSQ